MTTDRRARRRAVTALILLVPVPSLGVLAAMVTAPGPIGHTLFLLGKIWLLAFPAFWYLKVEGGPPSWSPPLEGGLGIGALSGVVITIFIILGARIAGVQTMDLGPLREAVDEMGLGSPAAFLAAAAGWTLVNSLMEEYVYRWFVLRQGEKLFSGLSSDPVLGDRLYRPPRPRRQPVPAPDSDGNGVCRCICGRSHLGVALPPLPLDLAGLDQPRHGGPGGLRHRLVAPVRLELWG